MENPNPQQNAQENPQQSQSAQQNQSGNGAAPAPPLPPEFVGLPPATEVEGGALNPEQRLQVAERYIAELLKGYQMAGNAINRLETNCFALVKIILDNDVSTWDGFVRAQKDLQGYEDLLVYWGIKEVPVPDGAEDAEKDNSDTSS